MRVIRDMGSKMTIANELVGLMWRRKMWWMIPIVVVLLLLGLLIGFGTATGVGPFVYTFF